MAERCERYMSRIKDSVDDYYEAASVAPSRGRSMTRKENKANGASSTAANGTAKPRSRSRSQKVINDNAAAKAALKEKGITNPSAIQIAQMKSKMKLNALGLSDSARKIAEDITKKKSQISALQKLNKKIKTENYKPKESKYQNPEDNDKEILRLKNEVTELEKELRTLTASKTEGGGRRGRRTHRQRKHRRSHRSRRH